MCTNAITSIIIHYINDVFAANWFYIPILMHFLPCKFWRLLFLDRDVGIFLNCVWKMAWSLEKSLVMKKSGSS